MIDETYTRRELTVVVNTLEKQLAGFFQELRTQERRQEEAWKGNAEAHTHLRQRVGALENTAESDEVVPAPMLFLGEPVDYWVDIKREVARLKAENERLRKRDFDWDTLLEQKHKAEADLAAAQKENERLRETLLFEQREKRELLGTKIKLTNENPKTRADLAAARETIGRYKEMERRVRLAKENAKVDAYGPTTDLRLNYILDALNEKGEGDGRAI